ISLPGNVAAGANVDITGNFTAPNTTGTQRATYRMQHGSTAFGQEFWVEINVTAAASDNAAYVSEGPPTDGTAITAGSTFSKRWTIRNSGQSAWTSGAFRATLALRDALPITISLPGNVAAGANVDITGNFTAPNTTG